MWNPIYAVAPFVLLMVSVPLALFAFVTASVAISLLSFRALIVYFQLAMAVIGAWFSPSTPKNVSPHPPPRSSPAQQSPTRVRPRRNSATSTTPGYDATSPAAHISRLPHKNNSLTALIGTSELTRDFEGVGGWRVAGDDDEEALWMGINSRLELPAQVPTRRHQRSVTGGASPSQRWSYHSPEVLRMSPVQSRARTPVRFAVDDESGYFPPQPTSQRRGSNSSPVEHHKRRKSGSGSSTPSSASAGMTMTVKEAGE
jgi:hypothetical protein